MGSRVPPPGAWKVLVMPNPACAAAARPVATDSKPLARFCGATAAPMAARLPPPAPLLSSPGWPVKRRSSRRRRASQPLPPATNWLSRLPPAPSAPISGFMRCKSLLQAAGPLRCSMSAMGCPPAKCVLNAWRQGVCSAALSFLNS